MTKNYLDDLIVFVRVIELKTFAAVAENYGVPPSAVSKQISRLEKNIGARLLNRTTHGLSETEIGRAIYIHACNILKESRSIDHLVDGFQSEPIGLLRVTSPVAFGNAHIAPLIPEFQKEYAKILISLELDNQYVDVAENGIDLVIRIAHGLTQNLMARPLAPIRYALCASPAYLDTYGTPSTLEDLRQHRCLIYGRFRTDDTWYFSDKAGTQYDVKVTGNVVANSTESLRILALADQGITLLPLFSIADELRSRKLKVLLPEWLPRGPFGDTLYAAYLPNPFLSPKVRVFIDFLVEKFGDTPYWDRH